MILHLAALAWLFRPALRNPGIKKIAFAQAGTLIPASILLFSIGLISTATSHEYWANFANIGRMFTPLVMAQTLLPLFAREASENSGAALLARGAAWGNGLFAVFLIYRELAGKPLPIMFL